MTIAEQIAGKLNAKLNYIPKTAQEEEDEKDEPKKTTFRKYEEELEINDFPQTARWKVTSKVFHFEILIDWNFWYQNDCCWWSVEVKYYYYTIKCIAQMLKWTMEGKSVGFDEKNEKL